VNDALIAYLKKHPESIYDLPPRKFEELLADLLTDMGWEVELTPATRDGGKDLLAYFNTGIGRLLCLVETKRYRRERRVGVDLIRTLYGTLCDLQANSAMLVTTSSFTSGARAFQRQHEYQLALRDYADVVKLIYSYKNADAGSGSG
jgi:restriction system protein